MVHIDPPVEFHQCNPRQVCKYWAHNLRLNADREIPITCRDPRCSLGCYQKYRQKEASILQRFLTKQLPSECQSYRGNLTLRPHATVSDHKAVVSGFFERIRYRQRRDKVVVRAYLTAHVTEQGQHYDIIVYSDLSKAKLREVVRESWLNAGGLRYSIVGLTDEDDQIKAAKYNAKDTEAERRKYQYLPAKNGIHLTRNSHDFFGDTSKERLWKDCISTWFPQDESKDITSTSDDVEASNISKGFYRNNSPHFHPQNDLPNSLQTAAITDDITDLQTDDILELDKRFRRAKDVDNKVKDYALSLVRRHLPKTPESSMTIRDLSRRISIPVGWLTTLLEVTEGVVRDGNNRVFMPVLPGSVLTTGTPVVLSERSERYQSFP